MYLKGFFTSSILLGYLVSSAMGGGGAGAAMAKRRNEAACETMANQTATCSPQQKMLAQGVINMMKATCETIQKNDGCDELRAELVKSGGADEASKKMQGCDEKSVCKQSLDWSGMQSQCIEGLKNFGKEAMEKVMKTGQAIADSATESAKCDKNEDGRKQKLYDDYNKTVPEMLKINPPPGRWIQEATCGEIMRKISGLNQILLKKYTDKMIAFEQQNPRAKSDISQYKDPELLAYKTWFLENGEKEAAEMRAKMKAIADAFKAIPALLDQFKVKMYCYNDATRAEMACHAAAAIVATIATGAAGTAATKALMLLAKSSGSVKVMQAVMAIQKVEKEEDKLVAAKEAAEKAARAAENGSGSARKAEAAAERVAKQTEKLAAQRERVLKKMDGMRGEKGDLQRQQLTRALGVVDDLPADVQEKRLKAVVDAHNICADSGFKQYSSDCLRKKAKVLKEAGYTAEEREYLMRNGIAGKYADGTDGFPLAETKKKISAPGSALDGASSVQKVMLADGRLVEVQVVGTKTEGGVIKHTLRNMKDEKLEISDSDLIKRSISTEPKPVQLRGSAYEGKSELVLTSKEGAVTALTVTGSEVVEGKIVHTVVYEAGGTKYGKKLTEDQLKELKVVAKAEAPTETRATASAAKPDTAPAKPEPAATKPPTTTPNSQISGSAAADTKPATASGRQNVGDQAGSDSSSNGRSSSDNSSHSSTGAASKPRTWSERVKASEDPNYVNDHNFPRAKMVDGAPVKVKVHNMDGTFEVEGEISGGVFYNEFTKTWQVRVKYQKGINTTKGHKMQGKPEYEYESIDIVDVAKGKPKPEFPSTAADPVVYKPIDPKIKKPTGDSVYDPNKSFDDQEYGFFHSRKEVDREAAGIFSDRRIGERSHIEQLQREINEDGWVRNQARLRDRNAQYVSEDGRFGDPRFDPKAYYAKIKEDAFAGDSAAKTALEGQYRYDIDNGAKLHNGARDKIREHIIATGKKAGKSDEDIAKDLSEMNNWMNRYDQTVPRAANYQKAVKAQAEFEKHTTELRQALEGPNKVILSQTRFEAMAKNLNDMMLKPQDREAAEIALRKLRCSRPEWKLNGNYGFNLKCD